MRKILKTMLSAVIVCITAMVVSVCAYAETEDVELSVTRAKATNGAWGQSITYAPSDFDCTRMTSDTIVKVEFELDGEWTGNGAPVELVLQNYSVEPQIWAKTVPFEYDETSASFSYEDMVAAYGSDDFSGVGNLCFGDCGIVMTATKFTVTNCTVIEVTTTTEATTVSETEAASETESAADTAAEETVTAAPASNDSSESGKIPLIPIVIVAVVVAVIVVVIIILKKSKQRFY